jgi:hypothetical protein
LLEHPEMFNIAQKFQEVNSFWGNYSQDLTNILAFTLRSPGIEREIHIADLENE